jgi:Family of unknown function (DUF6502)
MSDAARQRILTACYKLMRPIARVLLANGISYREFDEVTRQAFVQTASSEFGVRGRETNTSRIAAMTGMARKQVQEEKKKLSLEASESKRLLSPLADLLQRWATSEEYQDRTGSPKPLSLQDGGENSFSKLVQVCLGDVPAGAVKAELLRMGAVAISSEGELLLKKRSLIPDQAELRLESSLIYSLGGLASTIANNCDPNVRNSERLFERFVESPPVPEKEVPRIRRILRDRLSQVTEDFDSFLSEERYAEDSTPKRRVGIGFYYSE